jgi:hypothetical protein
VSTGATEANDADSLYRGESPLTCDVNGGGL